MAQVTEISGNVNEGYIAGRDLYLGDQYVVQETLYFEPDLTDVEPAVWTTTPKAEELARVLVKTRLVILAGQDLDDKTLVARHLAWLLRQGLPGEVRVREWYRSSDPQKIETAFHETDTTILLLPQVMPHHVGHRLHEISRLLHARGNYTIITTDGTRAEWGIQTGSPEEGVWQEISWESYYGRSFLTEVFLRELGSLNGHRPEWLPRDLRLDTQLVEGLSVEEAAARLKQPARIQSFVEWLQTEEASPRALLSQLEQLGGDRSAIRHWFQQLDRMDQLLALGLVLFDGLPDDQIFAAVEYLVDEAWRRTDPNLPLFDYRDLARLSAYFHLADAGEDGARIETSSQRKRQAILQAAWESQRRRLLAVVPAMTRLIKHLSPKPPEEEPVQEEVSIWKRQITFGKASPPEEAAKPAKEAKDQDDADERRFTQGPERELFSSPRRIEQLQRSVIESLSRIGLLSFEVVEASFLDLAVEGSAEVQKVVAKALAAWRSDGHHEELFKVLHAWWEAGSRTTPPKILEQRDGNAADLLASIRSTVVLAAGYALQYDPPNRLAPELVGLLNVAFTDVHPAVHQRLLELTLPLAAATHPRQLEPLLRDRLCQSQEQMYAIAFGMAMAFSLHPAEALRVIESWHMLARAQEPRPAGDRTIAPRERLLAAVALAYGYIRCEPDQKFLIPEQVVFALRSIFTGEPHPFVRAHAIMATGLQGLQNFEVVAPMLMELVSEIALPDRSTVVAVFVRAYLKEREKLNGGDGEVEIDGTLYQIWARSQRPLTTIEESLYIWLRDEAHPVARQVAAQTFAAFAATELERRERDLWLGLENIPAPSLQPALGIASKSRHLRRLHPWGHFAILCAAPSQRLVRTRIRPVLAEVIELDRSPQSASTPEAQLVPGEHVAQALLERWRATGDPDVQQLAGSAKRAFNVFRWRWAIVAFSVLASVLAMDVKDWLWSRQDPLPVDEAVLLVQRRSLPLRLARNRWLTEYEKFLAEQALIAAEIPEPEPVYEEAQPVETPPKKIPSGPMQQLRWSAIKAVPIVRNSDRENPLYQVFERILEALKEEDEAQAKAEAERAAAKAKATEEAEAAAAVSSSEPASPQPTSVDPPAAKPGAVSRPERVRPPRTETPRVDPVQEAPAQDQNLVAPEPAPSQAEPSYAAPELNPPPQKQEPEAPKWKNRIKSLFRKKPPKGDPNGNG